MTRDQCFFKIRPYLWLQAADLLARLTTFTWSPVQPGPAYRNPTYSEYLDVYGRLDCARFYARAAERDPNRPLSHDEFVRTNAAALYVYHHHTSPKGYTR